MLKGVRQVLDRANTLCIRAIENKWLSLANTLRIRAIENK
jgi:hypothetical protein